MAGVTVLWQDEPLGMDAERLAAIYVELGEARATAAVASAMEELAVALERMRGLRQTSRIPALAQLAARVRDIAEPLGMLSLSLVACDVTDAAQTGDGVALSATLARMERVANRSLKMVWDLQDLSG
ncbi:MAG: hypothetical protein WCD16_14710 [Paracoccaceae bacterium]